jgi:WD40 repeat protein
MDNKDEIVCVKIIHKDYQYYSIKRIDFNELKMEEISPEVKDNQYYLLTGYKNGFIKLWSIPEYTLVMQFEVVTEELISLDTTPNDLKLVASYSEYLRFFDLHEEKFIGRYKPITSKAFKHIVFLPDGEYLIAVDLNNTVLLLKIESYNPLLIQIHQLFNVNGDIYQFRLNPLDCYNKFLINLQNIYLCIYSRKFTNVIKNLSYDSSVPQFSLHDKFNVEEFLKKEYPIEINKNEIVYESFKFEFCTNDKNLLYILSEARKLVIIRNFEEKTNVKTITFPYSPINMQVSPNSAFVIYLFRGIL